MSVECFVASKPDIEWMLRDFADEVDEKLYNRLEYSLWKQIKNIPGSASFNYMSINTGIKIIYIGTDNLEHWIFLDINGNSFGKYIWDNFEYFQSELENEDYLTFSGIGTKEHNDKYINDRKDNDFMNFNFDFGPCTNDNVRMSMYGLAVKNSDGVWVSYDRNGKQIVDVDIFNFDGRKFMYKIPVAVKDIAVGDVVVHKRVPMFVESVENGIHVVDVFAGEKKNILPTSNMFGFNFVTKIVSVVDMGNVNANENNPFGNMLPLMLFADGNKNNKDFDPLMLMMLMNNGQLGDFSKNPLMMYALFGADNKDMLLPVILMNNGNFALPQPVPKAENPEG